MFEILFSSFFSKVHSYLYFTFYHLKMSLTSTSSFSYAKGERTAARKKKGGCGFVCKFLMERKWNIDKLCMNLLMKKYLLNSDPVPDHAEHRSARRTERQALLRVLWGRQISRQMQYPEYLWDVHPSRGQGGACEILGSLGKLPEGSDGWAEFWKGEFQDFEQCVERPRQKRGG